MSVYKIAIFIRWFRLLAPYKITHIVVIEVEGISHEDFTHNKSVLSSLDNPFTMVGRQNVEFLYGTIYL